MTKYQETTTAQLVNAAYNLKDKKGRYAIDFLTNGHAALERIVLDWERGAHTQGEFALFQSDIKLFTAVLSTEPPESLTVETWDKPNSVKWIAALSYYTHTSADCTRKSGESLDVVLYSLLEKCLPFRRLLIENKGVLEDAELLNISALPMLSVSWPASRYTLLDNLEKAMTLAGYNESSVASVIAPGLLKLRTYRKESR